jgi:hypothetical protein
MTREHMGVALALNVRPLFIYFFVENRRATYDTRASRGGAGAEMSGNHILKSTLYSALTETLNTKP